MNLPVEETTFLNEEETSILNSGGVTTFKPSLCNFYTFSCAT